MDTNKTCFTDQQYEAIYPEGIGRHYWVNARNKIITRTVKEYISQGKILEIGCGKGVVVDYLCRRNIDCYGIEPAEVSPLPEVADRIQAKMEISDLSADFCEQVATILLLDVIEHLPDPVHFMKHLRTQFPNLKTIVITVPACPELFSNYDEFNGHFRRYDLKMIENHAIKTEFQLSFSAFFFHLLYLPARFTLKFSGKRKLHMSVPKGGMKWIHKILSVCFFMEYLILPRRLKGTSALAVFRV